DEWLALEAQGQAWRLHKLDELALYAGSATEITAIVARDRRLLCLPLTVPAAGPSADTVRLDVQDATVAQRWLGLANSAPAAA
ncbi:MAG TPA: peptidase M61, partial [Alicycliphilus sp.]|nr:peptidase M61 [Alicycliphilus sp.]